MPIRFILSAYAGPMPRPVVPIFDFPKNLSETLSMALSALFKKALILLGAY